ncbi:MAG: hypothetical protein WC997_08180 [Porticoccaceae bacterium]
MPSDSHKFRPFTAPIVLACLLSVGACEQRADVREVTLSNLVEGSEHFIGRPVRTQGVVRSFPRPLHYWIEDDALNRVGLTPATLVEGLEGAQVQVTGIYRFQQGQGRLIEVAQMEVLPAP